MDVVSFQAHRGFASVPESALETLATEAGLDVTDDGSFGESKRADQLALALMVHYLPELNGTSLGIAPKIGFVVLYNLLAKVVLLRKVNVSVCSPAGHT
jgi:hypothetical protein